MSEGTAGPEFVQSLDRGLAVIRAFGAETPELTLSDVARSTGLSRAVARRFLHTLVTLGYVRTDGRLFALRPRVLELGYAYLSSLGLPEVARPHLEALAAEVNEGCSVTVLDGDHVVYVARVRSPRMMSLSISVGSRLPAYATSTGRVLLAGQPPESLDRYLASAPLVPLTDNTVVDKQELTQVLERIRADGYCLVDQELEEGVRSLAVPVHDPDGGVIAAMNVSTLASRGNAGTMVAEFLPSLQSAARLIEDDFARAAGRVPASRA